MRQTPVFLGRKRRDADAAIAMEAIDASSVDESATTESSSTVTPADSEDNIALPVTTETISFSVDGRPEKYIVARHVDVDVSYDASEDDDSTAAMYAISSNEQPIQQKQQQEEGGNN